MRLVVFAAPRGRLAAVEAILDVAKRVPEREVVCLGDAWGPLPEAPECVERLRRSGVLLVAGPADRAAATSANLPSADAAYLRAASVPRRLSAGARRLLLTHAEDAVDANATVVRPGAETSVAPACVTLARVADSQGEADVLIVDVDRGDLATRVVTWDAQTRHV